MPDAIRVASTGQTVEYTPVGAVVAGAVVARSDLVGVATAPIAAGVAGSLQVAGIVEFKKTSALAIAVGDDVYWNPVTAEANKTAGVRASVTLTFTGVALTGETTTIGTRVYTWRTTPALVDEIAVGANQAASQANLTAAINSGPPISGGPNTQVTAVNTGATVVLTAIDYGTAGNAIASTETLTNASFGSATLINGAGGAKIGKCVVAAANPSATVKVKMKQ